ncbi:DUF6412 domain-containing protein [Streptomyces sp. WMMC500]|uniref:DUF6412 domain-containing protein n=1 Tax=Streptomyces sp. WMMC500 TaxID=3015154 RepID=UPI00248B9095|nr:DUF6412 domain-containing protein [Streptomyces sp. WMMC500]WBB64631.1 DUF6412 domain-containing protein [Streptomyces sp. WMMC500]
MTRTRALAVALLLLAADVVLDETGVATGLAGAAASAALTLLAAVACVAAAVPPPSQAQIRTALRERALRTAFLPQRDPDSAGRPRPRAPGRRLSTAV